MNISIIIPAKNEEKYIENGLIAIQKSIVFFQQYYPASKVEIIVANNFSTDNTKKIAQKYTDKIFDTAADSIAEVRNSGASKSEYEILIFIDADSQMHIETLKTIYELINFTDVQAGCAWILPDEKIGIIYNFIIKFMNYIFEKLNTGSGLFFCKKQDFLAVNGFDEKIYAAEDLDFAHRIKKYLKSKNYKFRNIREIPIKTSMRKLKYVNKFQAFVKLVKFIFCYKKMMFQKNEWHEFFYNTNNLR